MVTTKQNIIFSIIVCLCLATSVKKTEAGVSYFIYDSPSRSVTALADISGSVVNEYKYDAFGDSNLINGSKNNNFTYVGEAEDSETNLIFLRHRYYDPSIGRFISKDPLPRQKNAPQSLNTFVYCQNNPINLADPEGLATLYYWKGHGGSKGEWWGHVSILLEDNTYISNWPADNSNYPYLSPSPSRTASYELDVLGEGRLSDYTAKVNNLNEQAMKAWYESSPKNFSAWYNCSDVFAKSLREGGLDMPHHFIYTPETVWKDVNQLSKSTPSFAGSPIGAVDYLLGKTPAYAAEISGPSNLLNLGSNIYADPAIFGGNYGGVSLSKTAQFLTDLSEIKGAFYDDKTGQIILLGKQNVSLPQMKLDDLAVAVNSVYSGTDPGVSIDPPLVDNLFSVRYDGKTSETEFGWVMFESDRIMKTLALGKDNISGQPVSSSVTGYKNLLERYREANSFPEGESSHRFWFKPKEMKLVKSEDGSSMVFDTATMECLTESKFQDNVIGDPQSEAFAANLTQYYDDYANQFTILKDLKRLGKVVSIVKWLKDNDIPIDLSFISNYPVPDYATPTNTPATTVSTQWQDGQIIKTLTLTGGVTYTKPNEYLADSSNIADPLKQAAISQRPLETDFKWTFNSPQNESLTAVAESFARLRKDGNLKFSSTDLSYPADCDFALVFTRYYDSFYDKQSAFGFGWEYRPFSLRFPEKKQNFTFGSSSLVLSLYPQVFVIDRARGQEDAYTLLGIDSANLPLYTKEGENNLLREISDGTLVLSKADNTKMVFDSQGNLLSTIDKNNKAISYTYQDGRLICINAGAAGAINITYSGDKIISVTGPGPRMINYGFDASGNLISVTNAENQSAHYEYDSDHRIIRITDARNNLIFEGTYDDYNRLITSQLNQELNFSHNFNLSQRKTIATDPNSNNSTKLYDDKYRVREQTDHLGNKVNISYDGDNGPAAVTDAKGASTQYTYDVHGNVSSVTQADASQLKLYYDAKDNLIAVRDAKGFDTAYGYDENNRLVKIYHQAILNFDALGNLTGWQYDPNNITTFTYDSLTGHLLSITNPEGRQQIFDNYNSCGLPRVIRSSSGFALNNIYDSLSRLTGITDPAGNNISFTYTDADQIESITTSAGTVYLGYDANNNLVSLKDAKDNETIFNYDAKNNLESVSDPEQGLTAYTYDKFNSLTGVTLPNNTKLGYEFDDLNRLVLVRSGMGVPVAVIAVLEDTLNVGTAVLGSSVTKTLTVYNIGTKDLTISSVSCSSSVFSIDTNATVIPRGDSFTFNITFTPFVEGQASGILTINSDDIESPVITINLSSQATLPSISPTAASTSNGVQVRWQQYNNSTGRFDHYAVYRSTSPITNISGLTPIAAISNITTLTYTDTTAASGNQYYYTVVAFDAGANKLTAVESYGPVECLILGTVGQAVNINSSYHELSSTIVYNGTQREYLTVYQYDSSGAGSNYDIYGQRIAADGQKIGSAFAILNSGYTEKNPSIVWNSAQNEYLAVGEYDSNGGGLYQIRAQRISANGSLIAGPINIISTQNGQYNPCVTHNSGENKYIIGFDCDYLNNGRTQLLIFALGADGSLVWGKYFSAGASASFKNPTAAYNNSLNQNLFVFEYTDSSTYSYIARLRIDSSGNQLGSISYVGLSYKSSNPEVIYNPDRSEYASAWQYDYSGNGQNYKIAAMRIKSDGTSASSVRVYTGLNSLLNPAITYFRGNNEYLLSFTDNSNTTQFDVFAMRIAAPTLDSIRNSLLSTYITIGASTRAEKNNGLVYNTDNKEFLVGFEYDANGDSSNWDVTLRRIGILTLDLSVSSPTSLDFGTADNQKILQITNNGGAPMNLRITSNQPWLTPAQQIVYTTASTYSHNVYVSRANLSPGNYSGNFHIDYGGGAIDIPVVMSVAAQAPGVPSNPSPADGAMNQADLGPTLSVTMSWSCTDQDAGDSLTYALYFSDDYSKVSNCDISCQVASNQTQTSYKSSQLQYLKTYYWRVIAKDSYGLTTSGPIWCFTTINITAPQIIPYSPDPTNNKRPTLSWNSVEGASRYHLQISSDSNFSLLIVNETNLSNTSYTLTSDLADGKRYWRVSSIGSLGNESAFSAVDDFTVKTTPPPAPTLITYTPNPTKEQRPTLSWQAAEGAVSYLLQISNTSDFSNLIVDKYVTTNSYTPENNLPEGTIYWRVSSKDLVGNESVFSDYSVFRIDVTAPAKILGLTATTTRTKVTLSWNSFNNNDGDFSHFNVYRSGSAITNVSGMVPLSEVITDFSATTFLDASVTKGTKYYYAVTAEDILGNEDKSVTGVGPLTSENHPPVLNAIGDRSVDENAPLTFTISAVDSDEDLLTYTASNFPSGASFNPETETFSWTPDYTQSGTYPNVHFEVSDGSLTDSEDTTITVNNVNRPPELGLIGDKTVNEGELLEFSISANDPDNQGLVYSASGLPSGAYFSAERKLFSWLPNYNQQGSHTIHFEVSDGSLSDYEDITVTVNNVIVNSASGQTVGVNLKVRVVQ